MIIREKIYSIADRGIFRNFTWFVIGANYRQFILFVLNIYLARTLGSEGYGFISFGYATLLVFAGIGDFGTRAIAWRDLARVKNDQFRFRAITGQFIILRSFTTIISVILFGLFIMTIDKTINEKMILSLFGIGIVFNTMTFDWPFRSLEKNQIPAFASIVFGSFMLITCVLLIKNPSDIFWFPIIFGLSYLFTAIYLMHYYYKSYNYPIFEISRRKLGDILRDSYPVGIGSSINRFNSAYPLIMLGLMMGDEALGNFRTAHLLYAFLLSFSVYLTGSVFSQLSNAFAKKQYSRINNYMRRMSYLVLLIFIPACFLIYLNSSNIMTLLFGKKAALNNTVILKILISVVPISIMNNVLRDMLTSIDRQLHMFILNLIQFVIIVVMIYYFISAFHVSGAAIGIIVSEIFGFLILCLYFSIYKMRT